MSAVSDVAGRLPAAMRSLAEGRGVVGWMDLGGRLDTPLGMGYHRVRAEMSFVPGTVRVTRGIRGSFAAARELSSGPEGMAAAVKVNNGVFTRMRNRYLVGQLQFNDAQLAGAGIARADAVSAVHDLNHMGYYNPMDSDVATQFFTRDGGVGTHPFAGPARWSGVSINHIPTNPKVPHVIAIPVAATAAVGAGLVATR